MSAALQSVSSVHVQIVTSLSGQPLTVGGDETLGDGKLTGYKFSETLPGSTTPLVLVFTGGKTYVQPPANLNDTGKPWILVSATSSNSFARTLATTLGQLQSSASIDSFGVLSQASSGLRTIGDETVGGVESTHYAFVVDVAKLPGSFSGKSALQQAGISSIPVDLWLDAQNRPVQAVQRISVSGQQTTTTIAISAYNKPVTITAPPADQVEHRLIYDNAPGSALGVAQQAPVRRISPCCIRTCDTTVGSCPSSRTLYCVSDGRAGTVKLNWQTPS